MTEQLASGEVVLNLRDVTRTHGSGATAVHALRGVSLEVRAGELVALMGPSGSGKSTLLAVAGGLDTPTTGAVFVDGRAMPDNDQGARARLRRTTMGYVFQNYNLIPALRAVENVSLPLELDGVRAGQARELAERALAEVGLADKAGRFPDDLSGGERQRVAIARAIVGERRLSSSQVRQAEAALADGRAVLIAPWNQTSEESVVQFLSFDTGGPMFETDASFLRAANGTSAVVLLPSARVLPEDVTVRQDAVWLKGELGQGQLLAVRRALLRDGLSASYETGRTDPPERSLNDLATVLVGAIAALVMLIGTITATLLALSDARDDLATLSAVGGTPRDRRRVVGATALVISGLGLVFGLVFSVLPAYAAARMASYRSWLPSSVATYDVPWALLSWLLLLPVITVAVAVLVAPRSPAWEERDGFAA